MRHVFLIAVLVALVGVAYLLLSGTDSAPAPEQTETQSRPELTKLPEPNKASDANMPAPTTTPTSTLPEAEPTETQTTPTPAVTVEPEPIPEPEPEVATQTVDTAEPEPEPNPVTVAPKKIAWGVFTGSNMNSLNDFERRVDANPDYLAWFVHWGNHGGELPYYVKDYAYEKGRTLILFWEASDYMIGGTDQPAYSYSRILAGDWDDYIEDFKQQLIDYEGDVILIPFSELNGDWTPWSGTENGNTPELAVEAFRYLYERMSDAPNISFGWAVNRMSVPNTYENRIERYYPGDAYVDYVGVDGFNKGNPWLTFHDIFHEPLMTLAQYNKPTFVFSFGSAPGSLKAEWLDTAFNIDMPKYPHLVGWVYFNQDKERNWLLWSDPVSFQVFEDYIEE